ncbi:MAG: nucleotide exchange factor GrpE [Spirochaetae bacterium HGW-Spirochaetae-3]|jgi:molecular chaperone GrpE|nr:MAG: nucleotide exchange factor GrpE [Spirochaetae bacterium HGW-Spirochaetae-3]
MSKQKKNASEERIDGIEPEGTGTPASEGQAMEDTAPKAEAEKAMTEAKNRISALESEVSALKDQYLRKLADYENFRKRMFREKDDAIQYANSQILTDLVGVLDDFERAIKSSELSKDFTSLHDGVGMIQKNLLGLLDSKYGLSRFDSEGAAFDPNVHEAVMSEQGECEEPCVVEEFVKGYKLRERVLRSAKVKVRMPLPVRDANDTNTSEENA